MKGIRGKLAWAGVAAMGLVLLIGLLSWVLPWTVVIDTPAHRLEIGGCALGHVGGIWRAFTDHRGRYNCRFQCTPPMVSHWGDLAEFTGRWESSGFRLQRWIFDERRWHAGNGREWVEQSLHLRSWWLVVPSGIAQTMMLVFWCRRKTGRWGIVLRHVLRAGASVGL